MAKPFSVQCPNCDARLKIQNPQAVGKKVRCPNCQNPFTVEAPRSGPARNDFDVDDDYEDDFGGGSHDDFGDDDDDFGPPKPSRKASAPRSSSSRSGKSPKSKKKSKKKKSNNAPLLIGGGVVAFLLLVGIGFLIYNVAGGGGGGIDSADVGWLPPNSQFVIAVDVDEVWNSKVVQRFANHPEAKGPLEEMKKELANIGFEPGESLDAIDNMVLGFEKEGDDPVGVFRKKSAWNLEAIKTKQNLQEQTHDGKTYYKMGNDAIYMPDDKTIVIGHEQQVKDAMTRGPTSNIAERFSFLSKGHIVVGALPEDLSKLKANLKPQGMAMMLGSKPYLQTITDGLQDLQGGGLAITFGSGVELEVLAKCTSSDGAGKISGGLNDMLSDAKLELNKNRAQMNQLPPPMKEFAEIGEAVFNSMDAGRSGDTASLSLELTSSTIDKIESASKQAGGGGFPGGGMFDLPKIPGLGNMFGGGGGGGGGGFGEGGDRSTDMNNLRQIGLAMHNYHDTNNKLPGGGQSQLSWRVHILPYIEQGPLYNQFHLDEPWSSPHNMALIPQMPQIYRRPGSNAAPGLTNYVGIDGPGAIMENGGGKKFADVQDGLSNTIMVTEVLDYAAVTWTQPIDYKYDASNPLRDLGGWSSGFHALLGDGAVRFIPKTIDPQNLLALFSGNDGKIPNGF